MSACIELARTPECWFIPAWYENVPKISLCVSAKATKSYHFRIFLYLIINFPKQKKNSQTITLFKNVSNSKCSCFHSSLRLWGSTAWTEGSFISDFNYAKPPGGLNPFSKTITSMLIWFSWSLKWHSGPPPKAPAPFQPPSQVPSNFLHVQNLLQVIRYRQRYSQIHREAVNENVWVRTRGNETLHVVGRRYMQI